MSNGVLTLCILVFFGRICDVSISTIKTVLTVKNRPIIAALCAVIEATIWFLVVREAFNTKEGLYFVAAAYALGYGVGTWLGSVLAEKYISGIIRVQVITSSDNHEMVNEIRRHGFGVTVIDAQGLNRSKKFVLLIETTKKRIHELQDLINELDSHSFVSLNETKVTYNGFIK